MNIVLATLGVLLAVEGLFFVFWTKQIKEFTTSYMKDTEKLKTIGWIEFIIGIGLLAILGILLI